MTPEEFEQMFKEWGEEQKVGSKVFQLITFFFIFTILIGFMWYNYHG